MRAAAKILRFPERKAGVPVFDPSNPHHVAAWEALWAFGRSEQRRMEQGQ